MQNKNLPWREYGYFLELQSYANIMDKKCKVSRNTHPNLDLKIPAPCQNPWGGRGGGVVGEEPGPISLSHYP